MGEITGLRGNLEVKIIKKGFSPQGLGIFKWRLYEY